MAAWIEIILNNEKQWYIIQIIHRISQVDNQLTFALILHIGFRVAEKGSCPLIFIAPLWKHTVRGLEEIPVAHSRGKDGSMAVW